VRLSPGDVSDHETPPPDLLAFPDSDDADGSAALAENSDCADGGWTAQAGAFTPRHGAGREGAGDKSAEEEMQTEEDKQPRGNAGGAGEDDLSLTEETALREVERAALRIQPAITLHRSLPLATVLAFFEGCAAAQLPGEQASDAPAPRLEHGVSYLDATLSPRCGDDSCRRDTAF
jgi:hypothetical protein